jgi:hypothetical protein
MRFGTQAGRLRCTHASSGPGPTASKDTYLGAGASSLSASDCRSLSLCSCWGGKPSQHSCCAHAAHGPAHAAGGAGQGRQRGTGARARRCPAQPSGAAALLRYAPDLLEDELALRNILAFGRAILGGGRRLSAGHRRHERVRPPLLQLLRPDLAAILAPRHGALSAERGFRALLIEVAILVPRHCSRAAAHRLHDCEWL